LGQYTHTVDGGGDHAFLLVLEAGNPDADVGEVRPADDGDAVIRFLAGEGDVIAERCELGDREVFVGEFGFLQADRIGLAGGKKVQQLGQADLE
jgi:hypothetical protein